MYSLELEGTIHDEEEKEGVSLRRLKSQLAMAGYPATSKSIAKVAKLSSASVTIRTRDPGKWMKRDIDEIINELKLTPEQIVDIFFCSTYAAGIVQQRKKDFEERLKLL